MFISILIIVIAFISNLNANEVLKKLDIRMATSNSLVCVGLDPDITKMPESIMNSSEQTVEDKVYKFLKQVIDITAPHVCCYKLQKAFYDQFDLGHMLLKKVVAYIHEQFNDIPVFVDCKIGDTDNTMKAYINLLFKDIQADGIVINPYMADDVFLPFAEDDKLVGIVLVQTSNPGAKVIQELQLIDGKKLWEEILTLTLKRWNKNKNLIVVLSSNTEKYDYKAIRQSIPQEVPILLAGIGAQGGNPMVLKQLLNDNKRGVFVNSSRGILYPYPIDTNNWQQHVLNAVIELKDSLNSIRESL